MAEIYQLETDKMKEIIGEAEAKQIRKDVAIQKAVDFVRDNAKEA